jgi:hypothetical protein
MGQILCSSDDTPASYFEYWIQAPVQWQIILTEVSQSVPQVVQST